MPVQCGVVGPSTSFSWSQTSLNTLFYSFFFALSWKWHWFAGMHVTWVLWGTLAIAGGHQTSRQCLLEGSKTLNCEKKLWEASSSGWFGCGRRILVLQSKRDTATCENPCAMWWCGSIYFGSVVSDSTKYTNKRICELIMPRATHLSKI